MTPEELVLLLRRTVSDVDAIAGLYTDQELWYALNDARIALKARNQRPFASTTVLDTTTELAWDITDIELSPELSEAQGWMLVLKAAIDILRQALQTRLLDGTLGIAWRSGTEEESSITAGQEYAKLIGKLDRELTTVVGVANASRAGTRPQ